MPRLEYTDHRKDPQAWATALGISREAIDVYLASDVIDLHVDSFIWHRIFGYDLTTRHDHGLLGARFYSQVDLPRIREAQVTGACWVITTNPARVATERRDAFVRNIEELRRILSSCPDDVAIVRNAREYRAARAAGKHAAFIGIQGGNALDADPSAIDLIPDDLVLRVTLVHLSSSSLGVTSSPAAGRARSKGLTEAGRRYVQRLNEKNVFVDLAHISREGFWEALEVHDKKKPAIVTHTGIDSVYPHWRNIDDRQVLAIAESGGTMGIMYHGQFLDGPYFGGKADAIVDHLARIVEVAGEDYASLGSDWDGAISTPRDMPTCLELPVLVERMLRRGWSGERIGKILGGNALRAIERLRG
ncbi:MAG: membrane dipeptidase [Myxococcales bacterium]|nr:membrane dipeptidase [Myxococcales bacterium]